MPAAVCWAVAVLVYPFHFVETKAPVQAALIQANIKQSLKWEPEYLVPTLNTYATLTHKSFTTNANYCLARIGFTRV